MRAVARVRSRMRGQARSARPVKGRCKAPAFVKQPKSSDFSQHIIASQLDIQSHMEDAITAGHPFAEYGDADNPSDLLDAVNNVCNKGARIMSWRRRQFTLLRQVSRQVQHITASLRLMQPASVAVVASDVNFGLMAVLCDALDWPDDQLVRNFVWGFPVIGDIPDSGVFSKGGQPYRKNLDSVLSSNAAWTSRLIDRCHRASKHPASPDDISLWDKTMGEVERGLIQGPFTRENLDHKDCYGYGKWRPIARFAVWQKGKLRPCDDAKRNFANDATRTHESLVCDSADFPLRMARAFTRRLPSVPQMLLGTEDLEAAYRRIPTSQPQFTVVALRDPVSGVLRFFKVPGHNFGLLSAVLNFNRVPEFFVHACRRMLSTCVSHFYDDYPVCEPSFSCPSSQRALIAFHRLIGLPLSGDKHVACSPLCDYLGITNDFSVMQQTGEIRIRMTSSRREDLVQRLSEALEARLLSPSAAASLHGKLQFALTAMFGKIGRAALVLIRRRATAPGSSHTVSDQMAADLAFLCHLVKVVPDFTATARPTTRAPLLVWSDAMYSTSTRTGGLGFVVWCPERCRFWHALKVLEHSELFELFGERKNYIGPLETLAAVSVLRSMPREVTQGRLILHSVDNQGSLSNLISGSSRDVSSAWLVHEQALVSAELGAGVWFEYVRSAANIADLPSRDALLEYFACLRQLGHTSPSIPVAMQYPESPVWRVPLS